MASAWQGEKPAFGLVLSTEDLAQVNRLRQSKGRAAVEGTPARRFLSRGKIGKLPWNGSSSRGRWWRVMDCRGVLEAGDHLMVHASHRAGNAENKARDRDVTKAHDQGTRLRHVTKAHDQGT